MPPRYAYWTILVDDQPTAFRAGSQEDLMPTFKRLQAKHASAKMMWFQNGRLWASRLEAQDAMRARGEMGRRRDVRQGGGFRSRNDASRPPASGKTPAGTRDHKTGPRPEWKPRPQNAIRKPAGSSRLEWKPKGEFTPAPRRTDRSERPEWKPTSSFERDRKPGWKPKPHASSFKPAERKLEWKPRDGSASARPSDRGELPKRKPIARSGSGRDKNWRPGGEHKDPKQKYKDAKKAKWTRFKQTIRARWEGKGKKREK